ncbi:endonuclease/exonuclease/phosphatase family protein [Aureimonas sp. ME7]|uniref:endonuclease/exonuclease/phosphatase family protein n=1 Tax=Aureimonas sp. ME7 TaxID=2744252 RepID=UPI0015F4F9D0|nr:endonuclease/exonuclease/phosphatase family protein [Aureimonas sp. ME7]
MSVPPSVEPRPFRVATWNVHGFIGEGRRPDPDRTLRLIEAIDPDVIALQEVDGRARLGRLPRAFERLGSSLGDHFVPAPLFGRPGEEYGIALWSRHAIARVVVHKLPGPGIEPRAAIDATIQTPMGDLRVVATHFGLNPRGRKAQAAVLASIVDPSEAAIVMGDFNEWRSDGAVHRTLVAALPTQAAGVTWPVRRPMFGLDRIYASRSVGIQGAGSFRQAAPASDHLPLVADIAF